MKNDEGRCEYARRCEEGRKSFSETRQDVEHKAAQGSGSFALRELGKIRE
jgi:hypothetical protein